MSTMEKVARVDGVYTTPAEVAEHLEWCRHQFNVERNYHRHHVALGNRNMAAFYLDGLAHWRESIAWWKRQEIWRNFMNSEIG